jgi:hypothetical protein
MRPRFSGRAPHGRSRFQALLQDSLDASDGIRGVTYESSAVLKVAERDRHFWSPQLHLALEGDEDQITIHGRFSPHPTVWSGFLALYLAIAFSGIIGVIFGTSQWTLGVTPTGLIAGPTAIALTGLVYLAARTGRRLGRDQMRELSIFLADATAFQQTDDA